MSRRQRFFCYAGLGLMVTAVFVWLLQSFRYAEGSSLFLTSIQAANSAMVPTQQQSPPQYLADADWRTISLPRSWPADDLQPVGLTQAWYRLPLPVEAHTQGWRHLLILRHMMNLEVWLDQHYLGSAGPVSSENMQRNWNRPVLWTLPEALITGAPQMLYFRLHSAPDFGVMSPLLLGGEAAIMSRYRLNHFLQIDLVKVSLLAMVFIACLGVFVWLRIRQRHWLLISLMSLSWSLPLLYILLPTVPAVLRDEFDFLRLSHWGTVAGASFLLAFIYSYYLQVAISRLRWLWPASLCHGAILLVAPDERVVLAGSLGQLLAQLLFVVLIIQLMRTKALRNAETYSIVCGLVIMLLAAGHDVSLAVSNSMERWRWDMFVSYITQPVMMMIITWHGVRAFLAGLKELDDLNAQLQQRLGQAEQDLRQVFDQQLTMQRDIHLASERELVYRDLHDDLGARLLSLVFKSAPGQARDLARSALQDLRDIVSRVTQEDHRLAAVIADCMAENENRALSLGKSFSWQADDALEHVSCSSRRMLKLRLLLRELSGHWLGLAHVRTLALTLTLVREHSSEMHILQIGIHCHGDVIAAEGVVSMAWPPLLLKRLQALEAHYVLETDPHQGMNLRVPMPVMVQDSATDLINVPNQPVPD